MFCYSNELQVGKFEVEKLANVWRPHLKSLPLNCYMSQNKTSTRNVQAQEKLSCTNLQFDLKLIRLEKNFLWHTWNLKLSTTWKSFLAHLKLQRWNFQQLELSFTLSQTWTLKLSTTWKTFFHTLTLTTLWRSLFHTSHSLGKVASSLYATTWKWTPIHIPN